MQNRNLSPRTISRSAALAESTVNQLLNGSLAPNLKILHSIAPVLQMQVSDLMVIADVPGESEATHRQAYAAAQEIGRLIALSSSLHPEHVQQLVERAQDLKDQALRDQE